MSPSPTCPKCGGILPANAPSGVCPKCLMLAGLAGEDSDLASGGGNPYAATTPQRSGGFNPPAPTALAALFPQLEILEVLGHGGMGAVYKARQSKLDRIVALKIIRPESADDPAFAERFNREARTLARLNHPQIVSVHDFGEVLLPDPQQGGQSRPLYYFVMEYVDGANLRQLMESRSVGPDQALAIIRQICEALQFAHDEGIVHRDIKPENVLIDSRGRVKIADFGLAKLAARSAGDFTLTATHQVMGTPHYMAPEQMTGSHHVDHRADIYSLGVVFYELLTGEVPMGQFEPPSKRAAIDARLDGIVLRALAREPERRFQQASEMKSSVDVISSASVMQPASTRTPLPPRGASTIFEREIANVWHWVAGQPATAPDATAQFPTLLALVLAVAGSLMVLLPWMDVTILDLETADAGDHVAWVESTTKPPRTGTPSVSLASFQSEGVDESARTLLAQASTLASDSATNESLMDNVIELQPGETATLYGSDVWPGLAASAVFACIALLVLMVPARFLKNWVWNLQIVILAGIAILQTVLFWMEVDGSFVSRSAPPPDSPPAVQAPSASSDTFHPRDNLLVQYSDGSAGRTSRLNDVAHRITYRPGFYGSIGLAIALLLLGATGVRRAVAERPEPAGDRPHAGSPIARVRFAVPVQENLGQQVLAHFESHGYRVQEQTADRWVFHRGSKMAGLYATDIRVYDTLLTVRTSPAQPGQLWISCLWEIRTLGAVVVGKDIATLEAEGRELELILNSNHPAGPTRGSQESFATKPFDSAAGASFAAVPMQFAAARSSSVSSTADAVSNLEEVRSELDGPSLAMIVVGAMIAIGHIGAVFVAMSNAHEERMAPLFLLGVISGLGMLLGGLSLRTLKSRGWAHLGIVSGFLPTGPGLVLAIPISAWSMAVFKRPHVAQAFLQAQRERVQLAEQTSLPRYSRKAIIGAFWAGLFALIALPGLMMSFVAIPSAEPDVGAGRLALGVVILLASPILFAPIGTTILGCLAIGDIRHSAGRIYGLGLAMFDALLFPLLLLNGTIFALAMYFNLQALKMENFALASIISLATTVAFGTAISAPIVKTVWKNETRMRDEATKA